MTDKIARVCDYCGKIDVLKKISDSNGMITVQSERANLLWMVDIKKGESRRPSFDLTDKAFCPDCLPKAIIKWVRGEK